ncbi:hypothetical protein TRFO_18337 [Tritrichomonas foetus]|uniref:Uncharacterized protein n=1 Tax=Tritrichomonas foetus TaxID=1144522 RepID=A0A1J4KLF0_9EUKA|nr:hypothetical protein TRFO_18337 [Tritrichomonas foetus]|eukprot:OHT11962.1 hypothetical protein TRFO_18337 [Tritrichomonas foetus]
MSSPVKRTASNSMPNQYLFQAVFQQLLTKFRPMLHQELFKLNEQLKLTPRPAATELFDTFPRSHHFYSQMIFDLSEIAQYDIRSCLYFLKNAIGEIVTQKKSKTFDILTINKQGTSTDLERSFQLLLLTDLICTIVLSVSELDIPSSTSLINCGIYLCMSPPHFDDFPILLLKQWSVIFSRISKLRQPVLFDRLTQLIINKYDLFFVLMRYIRLDTKGQNDEEDHSDDLLEIMTSHVKRAQSKKKLTSSMLVSLSTILMTYEGQSHCIQTILKIAMPYVEQNPKDCPGAVDLVANLIPYTGWSQKEINDFYQEKVYPLAETKEGIISAARAFRSLMYGIHINPDFLFYVWGPNTRTNSFEFLKWKVPEDKPQSDPNSFTSKFMKYFFTSKYFHLGSSLFRDILVRLASMDFSNYMTNVFPQFASLGIDSPQFMLFMNTVPMINDKQFLEISGVSKDDVDAFNVMFADTTNSQLRSMIDQLDNYGIAPSEKFLANHNNYSNEVDRILDRWGVDRGIAIDFQYEKKTSKTKVPIDSAKIVRIIPYMMNSPMFRTEEWMRSLVKLSALADQSIAKPAYNICLSIFQHVEVEQRKQFIQVILDMVDVDQLPEIVFICLKLLKDLIEYLSPDDDELEYRIEFAAFLALSSSFPRVRVKGFTLLIRVNKLLQNQGIYSKFEDHLPAIVSNVKHNILLHTFPRHPGSSEVRDEELSLDMLIYSRYQDPWLYFLAEFGRVLVCSNYVNILSRIGKLAHGFTPRENTNHFELGVLVLFFSTATFSPNLEENLYVYDMPPVSGEKAPRFYDDTQTVMQKFLEKGRYDTIFKAIKHTNYTIVHFILNILGKYASRKLFEALPSIHIFLSTIDGTINSKNLVKTSLNEHFMKICSEENMQKLTDLIRPKPNNSSSINNLNFKASIDDKKKRAITMDPTNERKFLCFLTFLNFCMELDINYDYRTSNAILAFLTNLMFEDVPITLKNYTSWCIMTKLSKTKIEGVNDISKKLRRISECERFGYHVLRPLLKNNNNQTILTLFIDSCFQRKSLMADAFFDAICNALPDPNGNSQEITQLYQSNAGVLILLGLLRLKTGSPLARDFLEKFVAFFVHSNKSQDEAPLAHKILENPAQNLERVAEQVVRSALQQMKNDKFKGTVKVMVDILTPWIERFQLGPRQGCCVPSININGQRYTPNQFLQDLLEVTTKTKYEHDFQRLVELWATLILLPNHEEIIPAYITEKATPTYRAQLFGQLLPKFSNLIMKILAKRCTFAFYAYVTYQRRGDLDKDNEFWMVPVIITAIKKYPASVEKYYPVLVHFAILFHSNQTQSLLKRLCKRFSLHYSRRTLSSTSIRRLVSQFENALKNETESASISTANSNEAIGFEGEDEENIDVKKHKIPKKPLDRWATEAMRWTIGSKNLRLAYTSIIILNELKHYEDTQITDLLRGVCKSVAFFLNSVDQQDSLLYDFIDEAFELFKRHFIGNELLAFQFIQSFLSFVVSVDAYFEKMLPLYQECLSSPITKTIAEKNLLAALRPSFNELESDSMAREAFHKFAHLTDPNNVDLKFVQMALRRSGHENKDEESRIINEANNDQLNRAFLHFSLMVVNASADMKRRIFVLSSNILQKMQMQRSEARIANKGETRMAQMMEPTTLDPMNTVEVNEGSEKKRHGEEEEVAEADKNDLNKQALVVIFNAAAQMLPGMREALEFIEVISRFDPLIATVPLIDEMEWKEAANVVIDEINSFANQESNTIISIANCKNLSVVTNLLTADNPIKILPFGPLHDTLNSIIQDQKKETKRVGGNWFDRISRNFISVGLELQKKMYDRVSPNPVSARGTWEPIQPPATMIPDAKLAKPPDVKIEAACTIEEFLAFPTS